MSELFFLSRSLVFPQTCGHPRREALELQPSETVSSGEFRCVEIVDCFVRTTRVLLWCGSLVAWSKCLSRIDRLALGFRIQVL